MLNIKRLPRVWTESERERRSVIQSRIVDFSLQRFRLCLTLAAAQSNMPLCWRERAMETCFLLFFPLTESLVVNTEQRLCLNTVMKMLLQQEEEITDRFQHHFFTFDLLSNPTLDLLCASAYMFEKRKKKLIKCNLKGPAFDCVCVQFDQQKYRLSRKRPVWIINYHVF